VSLRLFLLVALALGVIATAVGVVHARQLQRDELNIEFSRLQLEQATWSETNRIEQVATERLGMHFPEAAEMVVLRP